MTNVTMPDEHEKLELTPVAHFGHTAMAEMACEMMRNNGIRAVLSGAHFGALDPLPLPGGFSEIALLVPKAELERAQEIYEAYFAGDGQSQIDELPAASDEKLPVNTDDDER